MSDAPKLPLCSICGKPVVLETGKTDSNAEAVHEECYLLKVQAKESSKKKPPRRSED
jgi:hypothetical protein